MAGGGGNSGSSSFNNVSTTTDSLGLGELIRGSMPQRTAATEGSLNLWKDLIAAPYGATGSPLINKAAQHAFDSRIAQATTGPQFQQGGLARQGYAAGEAAASAQRDLLNQAQQAAQSTMVNNLGVGALAPNYETKRTSGTGNQSGSQVQGGVSCCFIFLQALNGLLPSVVREARDYYYAKWPRVARGYVRLARTLVPLMRVSRAVAQLVNVLMIKPMIAAGRATFAGDPSVARLAAVPVAYMWLGIFALLGRKE